MTRREGAFDASPFELSLSLPADRQFGPAVTTLAEQAARHVGCDEAVVAQFGADVVSALHQCLDAFTEGGAPPVELVLRRSAREIEAILTCGNRRRIARPIPTDA